MPDGVQENFPYTRGTGAADAIVVDGYVQLGFAIKRGVVDEEKGAEVPLLVIMSVIDIFSPVLSFVCFVDVRERIFCSGIRFRLLE